MERKGYDVRHMEYMTQKNIRIIAGVLLLLLALLVFVQYRNAEKNGMRNIREDANATSTAEIATSTSATSTTEGEIHTGAESSKGVVSTAVDKESSELQFAVQPQLNVPKVELGPRQPAEVVGDALKFFVEAMAAGDHERALSYFSPSVRPQYRASFETNYKNKHHPVVVAYYNGRVENPTVTEPGSGLYEIAVYPSKKGGLPFRPNFMYDSSVQEFVISEL